MSDEKNVRHLPVAWSEKAELRKKIAQAEKRLREAEKCKANFEKAKAALDKFHASGPHNKKKSGRPGLWKSPHSCGFVLEVERIQKERKCKTATAIRVAKKETIRLAKSVKACGIKDSVIELAARLARLTDAALQSRYQEARRYWLFVVDPEVYEKEKQSLERKVDEALTAWKVSLGTRNPFDFWGRVRSPYDFS